MKSRNFILLFFVFCASILAQAQDNKNTLPELYTVDQGFFDPTRKKTAAEEYKFSTSWRLELGYAQPHHRTKDTSVVYMHGVKLGATVDFILPYRFSIQTGALFTFTYGQNSQHWANVLPDDAQINILQHNLLQFQLSIPVRAYYNINVWKKLNIFFYAGPQLNVGLMHYDVLKPQVASSTLEWMEQQGMFTTSHDRYMTKELYRTNIQFGLGGGLEWDRYRLQAGYDFGLNNILRSPIADSYKRYEWGWMATFSYKL